MTHLCKFPAFRPKARAARPPSRLAQCQADLRHNLVPRLRLGTQRPRLRLDLSARYLRASARITVTARSVDTYLGGATRRANHHLIGRAAAYSIVYYTGVPFKRWWNFVD